MLADYKRLRAAAIAHVGEPHGVWWFSLPGFLIILVIHTWQIASALVQGMVKAVLVAPLVAIYMWFDLLIINLWYSFGRKKR